MKKNLLKALVVVAALFAGEVNVQAQETVEVTSSLDGWIRGNNESSQNFTNETMEVANYKNEADPTKDYKFWGIMQFDIEKKEYAQDGAYIGKQGQSSIRKRQ